MTLTIAPVSAVHTRAAKQNEISFGQNRVIDWIDRARTRANNWLNAFGPVEPHLTPRINMPLKKALLIVAGLTVAGFGVIWYTFGRGGS